MFFLTEEILENNGLIWLFIATQEAKIAKKRASCGHDRYAPRFPTRPEHHKARPLLLEELIKKIKEEVYFDYHKFLPSLSFNSKKRRSDRIEGICWVLILILHYTCLATLRISKGFNSDEFIPLALKELGINLPLWRISRAMKDLQRAGYIIQEYRRFAKSAGGYFSLNALRSITPKLLRHLGVSALKLARSKIFKQKKEEVDRYQRRGGGIKQMIVNAFKKTPTISNTNQSTAVMNDRDQLTLEFEQKMALIDKLRQEKYPELSGYQVGKLAEQHKMDTLTFLMLPRPEPPS